MDTVQNQLLLNTEQSQANLEREESSITVNSDQFHVSPLPRGQILPEDLQPPGNEPLSVRVGNV